MPLNEAELASVLRDLLVIAKVAMPPKLFSEDVRVTRALSLIKTLETGETSARPPNAVGRPPKLDISVLGSKRAVAESGRGISYVTELPWNLVEGLIDAAEDLPLDPAEATAFIVREWLTANGHLPLVPAREDTN